MEDSLKSMAIRIRTAGNDSSRIAMNLEFTRVLTQTLLLPGSFEYPLDSLKTVTRVTSPDDEFRILTWNLILDNGHYLYSGLIQWNDRRYPGRQIRELTDLSGSIPDPETAVLDERHWYGALYYDVIPGESGKRKIYTLLGWIGKSPIITEKVIEILTFDEQGDPRFGMAVFPDFEKGLNTRVLFRFSAGVSMVLLYDEQSYLVEKKWNASKRTWEREMKKERILVCDCLVPMDPALEGQYSYYIPSGEVYEGFRFGNGSWHFLREVDARNE
jgi:hypothetical protein